MRRNWQSIIFAAVCIATTVLWMRVLCQVAYYFWGKS